MTIDEANIAAAQSQKVLNEARAIGELQKVLNEARAIGELVANDFSLSSAVAAVASGDLSTLARGPESVYVLLSETYVEDGDIVGIFSSLDKAEAYKTLATPPVEDGRIVEWAVAGAATGALR